MKKMLLSFAALFAAATTAFADLYVTPTGAGAKDGSNWANAFAGIQAAVDAVDAAVAADANYAIPVIRVADGTYSRVSITNDIALDVRSVNGASATVIDGAGTNACVSVILGGYYNYGQSPKFTGFTLRNGNVRGQIQDCGGGAQGGSFVDCIIEDCQAWRGGGAYGANTMRSIIRRCSAPTWTGGIVFGGNHVNDLMYGCSGNSGLIYGATLYNCTVANNTASGSYYDFLYNSTIRNCILWGNTVNGAAYAQDDASDPKFVGGGDYRLRAGSPAIDSGDNDYADEQYVGTTDLAGNDRVQNTTIDRGCYEAENGQGLEGVLVLASAEGNGTVSPAHSFVNVGATVTITADTSTWHRDVAVWKTNGVVVAGATGNTLTFTATGEQIDVVAQFATLDWFVNGTTGSDTAHDGRTASTAFKTIQHAIDCAAPEEQIFVAAGTYAPIDASRANVAIIGDGRDTTIIDGCGTTRCADLGERNFSMMQGFTLRNGRHMNVGTTPGQGEEGTGGGGAKGGFLIDCAIENCHSTFGGGAFHSEIHRSIIRDCSAYEGGGAIFGAYFNCLFDRNWATQGGAASSASLWGCTVVRSRAVDFAAVYVSTAYSTIFWGNKSGNGRSNYWLQGHGECCFEEEMEDYNVSFTDDPLFVDPENGDFRLREDSPCIDCGWGAELRDEFDVRGTGYPRRIDALHGEEIADMGCYEGGVPGHIVSVRVDGWGNVSQRTFAVDNGGSATITATTDGRAFQKWLVDGVEAGTSPTLTLSNIDADHVVTACFQRNTTTVSGGGAALQNAINGASDGDTLVVADGIYSAIDARGKVLTIVSENGPAVAIIRGSSTTRTATLSTSMTHPASTLAGFTVEGGTSTDLLYGGGGVLGGTVSNCVIRGNSAYMGGGVAQAYVTHSVISNNTASVSGGGACATWLDTCLVVHNAANVNLAGFDLTPWGGGVPAANDNESGGGGIAFSAANFCTITRNTSTTYAGGGMFVVLDNTYIAGNTASGGPAARQNADLFPQYPNHVCATSPNFIDDEGFVNADQDNSLVDPDNGDYRLKATSLCVEGGDTAFVSHRYATDLDGNPRWRGSAPDIGCYEAAGAAPTVVSGVQASTGVGGDGVAVSWETTRGAEWYTVHRGTNDVFSTASQIGRVDSPGTNYVDAAAALSVRYRYWVVAHSSEMGDGPVGASVEGYWVSELLITTPYLPNGLTRELYSTNLAAFGGMPPYTWTVEMPSWLSVSGSTISGMPRSSGAQTVRVTVEDASGQSATRSWTLTIAKNPAPLGPATPYAGECYEGNYLIRNFDELRLFESVKHNEDGVNGSYFEGCTFTLTADIDCMGRAFVPTNSRMYEFKGVFDGAGHRIYNFTNDVHGCGSLVGVASSGAVVKNVTLEGYIRLSTLWDYWGTTALSTDWGAGAIAEYAEGSADGVPGLTIENCHFIGTIINDQSTANPNDNPYAGGLVGWVDNETLAWTNAPAGTVNVVISNSTVNAETVSAYQWAGGLVGIGWGVKVDGCTVTGTVSTAKSLGGLAGEVRKSWFTDCSFSGTVVTLRSISRSPMNGGGGLVGVAADVEFRNCSATGLVNWEYSVAHNNFVDRSFYLRTDSDYNYTASGGAAGLTYGTTAFYDCSFEGSIQSTNGFFGGFVGWTAGAETFSNCTARAVYAPGGMYFAYGTGGFAGNVASAGARFIDCSAEPLEGSKRILGGFFADQTPVEYWPIVSDGVGSNAFVRCSVSGFRNVDAGFAPMAWNCTFKGCTVRDVTSKGAGFVGSAGDPPGDAGYSYAQNSLYEDCSVADTKAILGFVQFANSGGKNGSTNVFRRCRASGTFNDGFGALGKGSTAEDCAVVGMSAGSFGAGFAGTISTGATVRRCVGAVMPLPSETFGAGFADSIGYDSVVEDCYSVYAPTAAAIYDRQEGGFVRSTTLGISSSSATSSGLDKIARCFTLGAIPATGCSYIGSFCGGTPEYPYGATYDVRFEDCYRPAESPVGDFSNQDHAGVAAFTRAEFANATAATMPNYDFDNVWHAPNGLASSPYLAASTDCGTSFWFAAAVVSGEGSILVNGEAPRESYPIGAVLTVRAVPTHPDCPFTGWVGEGFADPLAQETTYTVRNVSVIGATFGTPIYTVEDFFAIPDNASDVYVLMNDLDFTEHLSTNHYFQSVGNFQGKFFGQGHTIRYACTNSVSTEGAAAPFSSLTTGAQLRDLTVESVVSNCYGKAAGLVASIGNGVLVSNCHARLVGTAKPYPNSYDQEASCQYFGFVRTVSGTDIRIVDCTAEIKALANCSAAGFADTVSMTGGEIARCAAFAEIVATNDYCNSRFVSVSGGASGFAHYLSLSGGATVRECLAAGVVDAAANAAGFAYEISMRDDESQVRDCYSTAEVLAGASQNPAGFACRISDDNDNGGVLPLANCWFGGTVRCRGKASDYYKPYGFAYYLTGDVSFENCAWIEVPGVNEAGTAGVTALPQAASRQAASWTGYDFSDVWSMTDGATTPYFAWSLADGTSFRLFAVQEPGATITHPATALPGSNAAVSADPGETGAFFCSWAGAGAYANAGETPTTLLADNHRTVRAVWGKAITTRAELEAIADDPAGTYALGCDIDLGGEPWTPLCQDEYTPFTGTIYGNGHTISNLTVETETARAGLFGGLGAGATIADLHLANPVVRGANCVGTLAGYVEGATIGGCTVSGADVTATSERAGCFVGQIVGDTSVSRCSVVGDITGSDRYVGGFVGSVEGAAAIEKCYALGSVKGTGGEGFGGFVGYAAGNSVSFSECFACGAVAASGRGSVGGFAGYVGSSPAISDCYALADVTGGSYVGGFAGQLNYCNTAFDRCYAAGSTVGSSESGGFAGRQYRGSPSFTDCFRPADGLPDLGTDSADLAGIDALDAAGFLDADNFASFHDTGKWTQVDGKTQPFFAWGLVNGKMTLSGAIAGTGDGAITGLGAYEPGTVVQISAVPSGSVFLGWLGNAPYADASGQTTTVPLDNFRIVTAEFGKLISSREELEEIADNPAGSYALGADIDLSGAAWTPIGTSSQPFTGSLYGQGHSISGLTFANTSSGDSAGAHAGLFRYAKDATFVGIVLEDVDLDGYQYVGALAGEVQGATTIRDCSASGTTKSSNGCVGMLVGRVYNANGTVFEGCEAAGEVVSAGASAGGLVGDIYNSTVSFTDCAADVAVSGSGGNNKGGFVGYIEYGGSVSFTDCWTEGDVTAPSSQYVGGFVGNAARPVRCENCQTFGDTSGSSYTGGFVGQASGEGSAFEECVANGDVTTATANGSYAGGFVGYASGAKSRYEYCSGWGAVAAGSGSQVGGFVGQSSGAGIVFEDCLARGTDVRTTGSAVGGFAGKSSSSNDFTRCRAKVLAVSGSGSVGGFVGSSEGGNSQYAECEAHGSVAATGSGAGGFAGQTTGGGTRYSECRALGSAATTSNRAGGFAGYVSGANAFWRCFSAGSATASHEVGGFLGYNNGGGTTATECFALGDATATRTGNDAIAGGFLGYGYYGVGFTDCYCLGTVKGERVVGGFAGYLYDSGNTFTRCYAAGALECSGTWAGAFVGYPRNYGAITDCAALCTGDLHAFGTGTAGTSEAKENIAEYDAAGMKDSGNFDTWLAIDDADGAVWTQADGVTQPYLSWSSPDGDLMVYASIGGSSSGRISGAGVWYAPGDNATVTAIPDDGGFFAKWTGSTPYKSRTSATTQIPMDNHRVAAALLGKLITTPEALDAVRNDLGGIYGLGNDIDLADRDWTPLGNDSTKFTGTFYGFGHAVKNLTCTNGTTTSYTTNYRGLFGCTSGATLDGVSVANGNVAGNQYVGALVGRAYAGTSVSGCSASGKVNGYNGNAGGLVGYAAGTAFSDCSSAVDVTSASTYVGGLVGRVEGGSSFVRCSASGSVVSTGSTVGGLIGACDSGDAMVTVSGCRADGFVSGKGYVGGFVGYVSKPVLITGCAARGDVKSTGDNMGGFIGYLGNTSATNVNCWASGAVWGTGSNCGSFLGNWYYSRGTVENCDVSASANGARWFCGSSGAMKGGAVTDAEIAQRSAGWPEVEPRWKSATPITTAEQLLDVANHLDGCYRLATDVIDLGGAAWTPIGNSSTGFTGEFYGNNGCISNFVVEATASCAGLFGNIAGGRVEGVRAFGTVTSTSDQAGGFAGRICSRSLVAENAFVGTVSSSSTKVGGFAGYVYDQPSVFRCSAAGSVEKTGSANNSAYVGGFVGHHSGGFVADSYANADVAAVGTSGRVGGFAGESSGGKIERTYCSGRVDATSTTYVGAFGGNLTANIVTNSYYNSGATAQLAAGRYGSAAADYVGIDPVAGADMTKQASFPAFAFGTTWLSEDEDGPCHPFLKCSTSFAITSFSRWAKFRAGVPDGRPEDVVKGIPLAARYVFDIYDMDAVVTDGNEPVFRVEFDDAGEPYVQFAPHVYGTDQEVRLYVVAAVDLADLADLDPADLADLEERGVVEVFPVDLDEGKALPDYSAGVPPARFFRYLIEIGN